MQRTKVSGKESNASNLEKEEILSKSMYFQIDVRYERVKGFEVFLMIFLSWDAKNAFPLLLLTFIGRDYLDFKSTLIVPSD